MTEKQPDPSVSSETQAQADAYARLVTEAQAASARLSKMIEAGDLRSGTALLDETQADEADRGS